MTEDEMLDYEAKQYEVKRLEKKVRELQDANNKLRKGRIPKAFKEFMKTGWGITYGIFFTTCCFAVGGTLLVKLIIYLVS